MMIIASHALMFLAGLSACAAAVCYYLRSQTYIRFNPRQWKRAAFAAVCWFVAASILIYWKGCL